MTRVVVLMSGGVDSSVSAYLLKKQGYEVIGLSLDLLDTSCKTETYKACCSIYNIEYAKEVAYKLKIPHYVINLKKEFKEEIIDYFIKEYLHCRTPNPCVLCNKKIKFGLALKKAKELGADFISSGHYAKIYKNNGRIFLKKAADTKKDQSYFLYSLDKQQLSFIIFPLCDLKKEAVIEICKENISQKIANKPQSQQLCFIYPRRNLASFLIEHIKDIKPGPIYTEEGKYVGKHKGLIFYTIGQRKGLGIALGAPYYVVKLDLKNNTLIVGKEESLYKKTLYANSINWLVDELKLPMQVYAKIRYLHTPQLAYIYPISNDKIKVCFERPQRAITPGQSVVFYDNDDIVIGGGIITHKNDEIL